ncbi:MAG: DUF4124 domain-containing protein [Burkholderiales bacterium]
MKVLVLLAGLVALPAHADLYRWIDRETGSVKYSNFPPPWFGDPEKERRSPAVEVIPYRDPRAAKPAATDKPSPAAAAIAGLQARWTELARSFAALPATTDFERAGPGLRQQIEAYQVLSAELDRLDPAGAARRRAQEPAVVEVLRRGLER